MTRPKLPVLPMPDAADRRIIGIGIILIVAFLAACATLGLGFRIFWLTAGL